MTKVVACIIARTVSTRLPLKVLRHLDHGLTMLEFLIKRLHLVKNIDEIFVCTSTEDVDDILEDIATRAGVKLYRGSADQVIERMLAVGKVTNADVVLRITGDNPLTSYEYIDQQINLLIDKDLDYVRLIDSPIGATAEVIRYSALVRCNELMDPSVSEYLMLYMFDPKNFKCGVIKPFQEDFSSYSVTVDMPDDLKRTRLVIGHHTGDSIRITLKEIIDIYKTNELPAAELKPSGRIKLPYGKEISFEEFKQDMENRVASSVLINV